MKQCTHTAVSFRIRVNDGFSVILQAPENSSDRAALRYTGVWEIATTHPTLPDWIILPTHGGRGLSEDHWRRHWDDTRVEIQVQGDDTWRDFFN